jgi:Mn2+/Fe2+ NRAMP family transporter
VSILAELGLVGFSIFSFVAMRVGIAVGRAYFTTRLAYSRLIIGWLGASMVGIVFHSQSEGRLLDEPYLWLILAIFVAFETNAALIGPRGKTGSAAEPAAGAALPAVPAPAPGGTRPGTPGVPSPQGLTPDP